MAFLTETIKRRKEVITLALMLEFLHIAIWVDFGNPLSKSFLLAHLGLFLIWQPVWRSDEKLAWHNSLFFIILASAFVVWMNWWLLFGWIILLTGFCGGRVVIHRQERINYMIVLVYLVSELLIVCTAELFNVVISRNVTELFSTLLPVLPLLMVLLPVKGSQTTLQSVDLVHALGTATLVSLLTVGSLINMYQSNNDYQVALIQTLLAIGFFLFAISWLLNPRAGFSGFSQLWLRSILNIGTPFEQWLVEIANRFEQQNTPDEFLAATIEDLVALPWVAGAKWRSPGATGQHGEETRFESEFNTDELTVCLYSHTRIGGALYVHCKLLVRLINNFYVAKLREKKLTQQTHLQAIYETGARVTHDIKNLLQSLHAITSIIMHDKNTSDTSVTRSLLERQLPHFTQRLQLALDKLQTPDNPDQEVVYLKDWWQDLKGRNSMKNLHYQSDLSGDPVIPADLFDSVIENLFENLREKSQLQDGLEITVSLFCDERSIHLTICDNGRRIPDEIAAVILKEPLKSDQGLGIGLYQAAQQAASLAYNLQLKNNLDGRVCFELWTDLHNLDGIAEKFSG